MTGRGRIIAAVLAVALPGAMTAVAEEAAVEAAPACSSCDARHQGLARQKASLTVTLPQTGSAALPACADLTEGGDTACQPAPAALAPPSPEAP